MLFTQHNLVYIIRRRPYLVIMMILRRVHMTGNGRLMSLVDSNENALPFIQGLTVLKSTMCIVLDGYSNSITLLERSAKSQVNMLQGNEFALYRGSLHSDYWVHFGTIVVDLSRMRAQFDLQISYRQQHNIAHFFII